MEKRKESTSIRGQVWGKEGSRSVKLFVINFDSFKDIVAYEDETGYKVEPLQFIVTRGIGDVDVYSI